MKYLKLLQSFFKSLLPPIHQSFLNFFIHFIFCLNRLMKQFQITWMDYQTPLKITKQPSWGVYLLWSKYFPTTEQKNVEKLFHNWKKSIIYEWFFCFNCLLDNNKNSSTKLKYARFSHDIIELPSRYFYILCGLYYKTWSSEATRIWN